MQKDNEEAEAAQQDYAFVEPQFRIGQRVEHKENGMTGVIVGWDRACCESEKWQQENWISDLSKVCSKCALFLKLAFALVSPLTSYKRTNGTALLELSLMGFR
jgi:hypothetical protein